MLKSFPNHKQNGVEMSRNKKGAIADSKVGNRPSLKKLKRFVDRGGYAILESMGEGETPKEKQMNGWEKWGVFPKLQEKTGLSRPTLYRIKSWFPTIESTGMPKGVWIKQEDYERLKEAYSGLKGAEKLLKGVQKCFRHSLIVDLAELRVRQELLGESLESFQLALKQQVEADEKQQSTMEKMLDNTLQELDCALMDLRSVIAKF